MERRDFFRAMLGAAALLPPSQVWPFRKIFIPSWLYQEPFSEGAFWITLATPGNFKPGDRVQIYRHVKGLPDYYLVKNVDLTGINVVTEMPSPGQWLNLGRYPWQKRK